jgi:hypothetical protein
VSAVRGDQGKVQWASREAKHQRVSPLGGTNADAAGCRGEGEGGNIRLPSERLVIEGWPGLEAIEDLASIGVWVNGYAEALLYHIEQGGIGHAKPPEQKAGTKPI